MGSGLFDLEGNFSFYGAYHSNPVNIAVHMVFVWPIFFTALLLLYFTPSAQLLGHSFLVFNFSFLIALVYGLYYVSLDKKAGSLAALLCLLCWIGSSALGHRLGYSLAWKVVLASQILCWTGQFIGHGVFEKRAPALLDNLTQAFLMAPFFVLLECLKFAFDYEPYPGFHSKVTAKVNEEIKAYKEKKSS